MSQNYIQGQWVAASGQTTVQVINPSTEEMLAEMQLASVQDVDQAILAADQALASWSKTSVEIMKLFGDIHAAGNTVILVTHEEDIAAYAHRIIRLRDGLIESDTQNPNIKK